MLRSQVLERSHADAGKDLRTSGVCVLLKCRWRYAVNPYSFPGVYGYGKCLSVYRGDVRRLLNLGLWHGKSTDMNLAQRAPYAQCSMSRICRSPTGCIAFASRSPRGVHDGEGLDDPTITIHCRPPVKLYRLL